jgi:hypothetical protein
MAYQHANRLTAHWLPKTLKASTKLVAKHLAENIQAEGELAGRFWHSAEKIAAELGLGEKTTYRALGELMEAKLFDCEVLNIHRATGLRTYSMAIECPPDCTDTAKHYTPLERAARPQVQKVATSQNDHSDTPTTSQNDQPYKELLNKEIDIDIENSPSLISENLAAIYLESIRKALAGVETETANHLLLKTCLEANPALVAVDALRISQRATKNPEAYLAKTAKETPESLLEAVRASLVTDTDNQSKEWPVALKRVLLDNALDIVGERGEAQKLYNEYLFGSGAIPTDLVAIAETNFVGYPSLEHLVADCRAISYGFNDIRLNLNPLVIELADFEKPLKADFGTALDAYTEALELHEKRLAYQAAFDSRQPDLVEAWLQVHNDSDKEAALKSEQIEALEAERMANPELSGDREHYARLIMTELHNLPALETLTDYLASAENLQSVVVPQLQTEFEEFWNAYPSRPEGKGRKIAALKAWCEARKTYDHHELMSELRGSFFGVEPAFIPWPTSWLTNTAQQPNQHPPLIGKRL